MGQRSGEGVRALKAHLTPVSVVFGNIGAGIIFRPGYVSVTWRQGNSHPLKQFPHNICLLNIYTALQIYKVVFVFSYHCCTVGTLTIYRNGICRS